MYVVPKPQKGSQKRKTAVFPVKSHFLLEESLLQGFFVWKCLPQSGRAFIDLTIRGKMIGGDVPLNINFALSKLLLSAAEMLSRIVTNALFASQLLQWNIKLLILFTVWINWCVWMHSICCAINVLHGLSSEHKETDHSFELKRWHSDLNVRMSLFPQVGLWSSVCCQFVFVSGSCVPNA